MIKIAILEDLVDVAESMKFYINNQSNMQCLYHYVNAEDAILFIPHNDLDMLIVDIGLPRASGIEAITHLSEICPKLLFCMFTVYEDDDKIFQSLKAGAKGYILKNSSQEKIITSIQELYEGGSPMSPSIARRIIDSFSNFKVIPANSTLPITNREQELLALLSQGMLYKEIGDQLGITIGTVKQHIHKIYDKLQVTNRTEAINKFAGQ